MSTSRFRDPPSPTLITSPPPYHPNPTPKLRIRSPALTRAFRHRSNASPQNIRIFTYPSARRSPNEFTILTASPAVDASGCSSTGQPSSALPARKSRGAAASVLHRRSPFGPNPRVFIGPASTCCDQCSCYLDETGAPASGRCT